MKAEVIKNSVEELRKDLEDARQKVRMLEQMIRTYENLCPHRWEDGSEAWILQTGIRYKKQVCAICGKEEDLR